MKNGLKYAALPAVLLLGGIASAEVKVPPLFSDHAVLARSAGTTVFGEAAPGETVAVTLGPHRGTAQAGADGKWRIVLDLSASAPGPFEMEVAGSNRLVFKDIVVGEVWLCSGQSNMAFTLNRCEGAEGEIAASANPMLRCFTVRQNCAPEPVAEFDGAWQVAEPKTVPRFTAVGYFFGKELQRQLGVPVGIVNSSWPGTPVEAWTGRKAQERIPELKKNAEAIERSFASYDGNLQRYLAACRAWRKQYGREDAGSQSANTESWKPLKSFPFRMPKNGGAVTLRSSRELPGGKNCALSLGRANVESALFWNGAACGERKLEQVATGRPENYRIPAAQVKPGANEIMIRYFSAEPAASIECPVLDGNRLEGGWEYRINSEFPPLSAEAKAAQPPPPGTQPQQQHQPGYLYNAMIHPLIPFRFSGAVWYQGEGNVGKSGLYEQSFRTMIESWREEFGMELPFYHCQLANYRRKEKEPGESRWAELRDAQSRTLALPHTGQAVLIDLGEALDIHPRDKKTVGVRLAAAALAGVYGKSLPFSGPRFREAELEGGKVRIRFDHSGEGLVAREIPATYPLRTLDNSTAPLERNRPQSGLEGFALAGADGKWHWADAAIDGDSVLVWAAEVPAPAAVRYGWADNPTCNLYNKEGFPAAPFEAKEIRKSGR